MTAQNLRSSALVIAAALALTSPMRAQSGHELFQQALSKERAEGKLQDAIALYQRVVDVASADHALAAKALLQLGRCYEQLGSIEARSAYERLIARYPDQADVVAQAKSRLAALVRTAPSTAPSASMIVHSLPDVARDGELVTVSTDGTKAIVMDYSKGQNIALYDFARKQRRLLTSLDWTMGWTYFAAWSPDARRVAYVQASVYSDQTELRLATLDGRSSSIYRSGPPDVQPVGSTPDGATLLVVFRRPDRTWTVGTLPATGGSFTPLRSLGWLFDARLGLPRLSPDGKFVAFVEGERGLRDVHVVSLDGRDAYRITDDPADDMAPTWAPDGRHLAFMSTRLGSVSLWTIEVKDGKPVGPAVKVKDGMQSARVIDWTDRGIFYDQQTTTWDLFTVPMDPVERRQTGPPRLIPYPRTGRNVSPAWSPDGGRFAFVSSSAAEPNRRYVVVMPADGGQAREFLIPTTTYEYPQSPPDLRWFGDGRGLGFSGRDNRGAPAVFRLRLETGEWDTTPLSGARMLRIEWNRDGSAFYFSRESTGNPGIFERSVTSDVERLVYRTKPRSMIRSLEFSPDRKWLAFQERSLSEANQSVNSWYLILDVERGEARTLLEDVMSLANTGAPHLLGWTPSGDLIVHKQSRIGAPAETLLVPVNGSAPRAVAIPRLAPTGPREQEPDVIAKWSSTGRWMVLGRVSRGAETFVIENPVAAVRATVASR